MTIPAKRFTFLNDETNLATADFYNPQTNEIFNSPNLIDTTMDADMAGFLDQSFGVSSITLSQPTDPLVSQTRPTKDAFSGLKSISSLNTGALATSLFPGNGAAQGIFKQLTGKCATGPMSRYNAGKPYNPAVNCGGQNKRGPSGGCSPSSISDILNKLTNSQYGSAVTDLNHALSALVALATMGYNGNLCGVFGALSGGAGLTTGVLSRGAGMLIGSLTAGKNLTGIFDVSGQVGVQNLNVIQEFPGAPTAILNSIAMPFDARQRDMVSLNNSIGGSLDAIKPNWNTSTYDGAYSCAAATEYSGDYDSILRAGSTNRSIGSDISDLDTIPSDDSIFNRAGISGLGSSGGSSFGSFFP